MSHDLRTEKGKLLLAALTQLGEHFDSVQIIATGRVGGETFLFHQETGNLYAVQSAVSEVAAKFSGSGAQPDAEEGDDDDE